MGSQEKLHKLQPDLVSAVICCTFACKLQLTCDIRSKSKTYSNVLCSKVDEWQSDASLLPSLTCFFSHGQLQLAADVRGRAGTDASWQNYPDHQCVPESWTLPCNQRTPWGEGLPLLMQHLPCSQWDFHRAHCCSCNQGVSQKLWSTWYINVTLFSPSFCHWPYWPPGVQPECSDKEWHGVTVILGGQQCPAGSGMQIVQVCVRLLSEDVGPKYGRITYA